MRKATARRFLEEKGDAKNNDVCVRRRGDETFRRCAGDVEVLRFRASHASQGKTVDQVIVSVPVDAFSQTNEAQFYVSMSRARHAMHLYTDSKVALKEAVMRPSERLSPLELVEGIKSERPFVAGVQYARAAAKSNKPYRENWSFVYTQQDRNKATEREPEL